MFWMCHILHFQDNPDVFAQEYVRKQLFTKIVPTYTCPLNTGYNVYPCGSCGDQFLLKSSYEFHINRESLLITHLCKSCDKKLDFTNKCQLFLHLKTHPNSIINLTDITIAPLPLSKFSPLLSSSIAENTSVSGTIIPTGTEEQSKFPPESCVATALATPTISNATTPPVPDTPDTNPTDSQSSSTPATSPKKPQRIRIKNMKKFFCPVCNYKFDATSNILLKKNKYDHFQRVSTPKECNKCAKEFDNSCSLAAHKLQHENKAFICHECGYETSSSADLQVHIKYGCPAGDTYVECFMTHCTNVCLEKNFKEHFINAHTKMIFKCITCDFSCGTPHLLKIHSQKIHNVPLLKGNSIYLCGLCSTYVSKININDHIGEHYDANKRDKTSKVCKGCNNCFLDINSYTQHMKKCDSRKSNESFKSKEVIKNISKTNSSEKIVTTKSQDPYETIQPSNDAASEDSDVTYPIEKIKVEVCIDRKSDKEDISANDASFESSQSPIKSTNSSLLKRSVQMGESAIGKAKKRRKLWGKRKSPAGNCNDSMNETGMVFVERTDCDDYNCCKCLFTTTDRGFFHEHLLTHRHITTSHQCMECGACFATKSSFSTHLSVVHGILDPDNYFYTESGSK